MVPSNREGRALETTAVLFENPGDVQLRAIPISDPGPADVIVRVDHSGISTGTEKLLFSGQMPHFPGMGYPLVPGYESVGEVVEAGPESRLRPGQWVFVPGADCYAPVRGLFGGAARHLVSAGDRLVPVDRELAQQEVLLALAATARHSVAGLGRSLPDLIVGHGVLGRLLARITIAAGGAPPTVWDIAADRRGSTQAYPVLHPEDDPRRDYSAIYDVSGDPAILDQLIGRLVRGGEIVLAGFYADPLSFAFPPAFMKEARLRVSAEWTRADMQATRLLVEEGALSLDGLITHSEAATNAQEAYRTAFEDPQCLKMVLDWRDCG